VVKLQLTGSAVEVQQTAVLSAEIQGVLGQGRVKRCLVQAQHLDHFLGVNHLDVQPARMKVRFVHASQVLLLVLVREGRERDDGDALDDTRLARRSHSARAPCPKRPAAGCGWQRAART
jgi:hypothetical protein